LILASASPRRSALLAERGLEFEVRPSHVDESLDRAYEPEEAATLLACRKALAVAESLRGQEAWVIGSDTVVAVDSGPGFELLGKPEDDREARRMLELLSDSRHRVVTGVAVVACGRWAAGEPGEACLSGWERTWVSMRTITPEEIDAYLASGEWRGKAGGYAIQENADAFVTGLEEGGFDNVVGLPVELTLRLLKSSGAPAGD